MGHNFCLRVVCGAVSEIGRMFKVPGVSVAASVTSNEP
jgi:hypothetical protein